MITIKNVIIEGTDCSGKDTLIRNLHVLTKYKYNLINRSYLSRVCYAKQFFRNIEIERVGLLDELNNLNNVYIVLHPTKQQIIDRYMIRGDDIQNEESLNDLYKIYEDEITLINSRKNVFVYTDECSDLETLTKKVNFDLQSFEKSEFDEIGSLIISSVDNRNHEATLDLKLSFQSTENSYFVFPKHEEEYYDTQLKNIVNVIKDEMIGKNPYFSPQCAKTTRRFYYSDNTCISSIHFVPREDKLTVLCCLRSTDVVRNAKCDTQFLAWISSYVNDRFCWGCTNIDVVLRFNIAHLRLDLI